MSMHRRQTSVRPRRSRGFLPALAIGVVLVAGVSVVPAGATGSAGAIDGDLGAHKVAVKTFRFRPASLEVAAGTKVKWKNKDQVEHTVTGADDAASELDGTLSGKGEKYAVRLTEPGTYEYFCARHPSMKGTIVVE